MSALARLLSVLAVLCLPGFVFAQNKVLNPERLERATTTDEKGLTQWAEWKAEKCPNCSGTGKTKCATCERFQDDAPNCVECGRNKDRTTTCRMCAGSGTLPDPLEKVGCPGCLGASFFECTICGGGGRIKIGGDKKFGDCVGCRGTGGWKCGVCNGARLVEPAALKPSMKDASTKDLQKAMAATEQALKELTVISPAGGDKARKDVKAMVKAFEAAQAYHPAMKRLGKPFEDYMGKIYAGKQFQGAAENEANTMAMVKNSAEYYLKHQKRMLELAQKRAEANEKLAAEQKAK